MGGPRSRPRRPLGPRRSTRPAFGTLPTRIGQFVVFRQAAATGIALADASSSAASAAAVVAALCAAQPRVHVGSRRTVEQRLALALRRAAEVGSGREAA